MAEPHSSILGKVSLKSRLGPHDASRIARTSSPEPQSLFLLSWPQLSSCSVRSLNYPFYKICLTTCWVLRGEWALAFSPEALQLAICPLRARVD